MIDACRYYRLTLESLEDLRVPPGNRLEKLAGDRQGRHSIRINDQRASKVPAIHPGEILQEEFLKPLGISQYRLAKDTRVPARRVNEIVHGTRAITADTTLRLARYFGTSPAFWMNLQARYDLDVHSDMMGARIEHDIAALDASLTHREAGSAIERGIAASRRVISSRTGGSSAAAKGESGR